MWTSHVERHNLSIRTFLRRFARLAIGFSEKREDLASYIALSVAHYNFCRPHRNLLGTPTMAVDVVRHPWSLEEMQEAERMESYGFGLRIRVNSISSGSGAGQLARQIWGRQLPASAV
jgi:hypothetical protein